MASELEKQFFDTFDIQYEFCSDNCLNPCRFQCDDCGFRTERYPEITDRILLELICILTRWHLDEREPYEIMSINTEQLKNQILSNSLYIAKSAKAKQQVQALFKECNNDK